MFQLSPATRDKLVKASASAIRSLVVLLMYQAVKRGYVPQSLVDTFGQDVVMYAATGLTVVGMYMWSWLRTKSQHNVIASALLEKNTTTVDQFLTDVKKAASNEKGFFLIPPAIAIAVAALAVGGLLAIAHVHVPILNPQTKIQAAKTDRVLFEAVRAVQIEEEKLFKNSSVPALHVKQADGKTLHQHIAVEELAVYHLIERVANALQKMPVGGTLSVTDLGFVVDLEHAVADFVALVRPVLGATFADAVDQVSQYAAQFSAAAKAVK